MESPDRSLEMIVQTYAGELGAAVAALGDGAALLDVQQTELATGSLDDSGPVGSSVVTGVANVSQRSGKSTEMVAGLNFGRCILRMLNSRVAAAVGDSLGRHFGGWLLEFDECISPENECEEFRDLAKFVWATTACAR